MTDRDRRRFRVVTAAFLVVAVVVVGRLVDVQVVQAQQLDRAAGSVETITQTLYGKRGPILGRDGTALADSVSRYNITTAPKVVAPFTGKLGGTRVQTVSVHAALSALARVAGGSVTTMEHTIEANPHSDFTYLIKRVDVATYTKVLRLGIPWIYSEQEPGRLYPDGAIAGNLTGFMGTDGPLAGLEYAENSCLAAANGMETYQRSETGIPLPGTKVVEKAPVNGGRLATTIDPDLQYLAEQDIATAAQTIKAASATAIVINAATGGIRALADYPTVDPNNVSPTAATDPAALGSQALTAAYEPGSTIKAIIASALIQQGLATPTSHATVPYARAFPWGGRIHDAEVHPTEHLTLTGILAQSSNVGITLLGQQLSAQTRFDYMRRFGLFEPQSAITYPGQPSWPRAAKPSWGPQTNMNSMFGQGIATTALQVAGIYQTLANHGIRVPLHFVKGCRTPSGKLVDAPQDTPIRVVSSSTARQVVDMLQSTFNPAANGTLSTMVPISGYAISAKTGTAQVARSGGRGYGNNTIISVEGIAPTAHPKYVVAVAFTKPQTNRMSSAAAPAFRELMTQVLTKYRIAPGRGGTIFPTTW